VHLAHKRWKERVEDREQEERIQEMYQDESCKDLQWISEAMIILVNMIGKTKCKKCRQSSDLGTQGSDTWRQM